MEPTALTLIMEDGVCQHFYVKANVTLILNVIIFKNKFTMHYHSSRAFSLTKTNKRTKSWEPEARAGKILAGSGAGVVARSPVAWNLAWVGNVGSNQERSPGTGTDSQEGRGLVARRLAVP